MLVATAVPRGAPSSRCRVPVPVPGTSPARGSSSSGSPEPALPAAGISSSLLAAPGGKQTEPAAHQRDGKFCLLGLDPSGWRPPSPAVIKHLGEALAFLPCFYLFFFFHEYLAR